MKNTVGFGQKGSCFLAECEEITSETYNEIKEFCKLKVLSGYSPESGIIISAKDEIRYLTLGGIAGNVFPLHFRQHYSYVLEF